MTFEEYKALIDEIDYHMNRYYNDNEPEISDYEYDQLMQKLKHAEKEHPDWVTPESPSQKIGGVAQREAGVKVTHDVPMLSIEDVFDKADVTAWIEKVHALHPDAEFSVEAKIDGLSMTLRYEKDSRGQLKLSLAETRGDGLIGEDVTANALVIPDVKQYLDFDFDELQLRGEVYMSHEDFARYNDLQERKGGKIAANPRNLAAGTLRQLDANITKERGLKMFVFNVQKGPKELTISHTEGMDLLEKHGIKTVFHKKCKTVDEVLAVIDEIGEKRGEFPFDIDGAVVKIDQVTYRNDFSTSAKYSNGHIATSIRRKKKKQSFWTLSYLWDEPDASIRLQFLNPFVCAELLLVVLPCITRILLTNLGLESEIPWWFINPVKSFRRSKKWCMQSAQRVLKPIRFQMSARCVVVR